MVTGWEMHNLCEAQNVGLDRIIGGTLLHVRPLGSCPTPVLTTIRTSSGRLSKLPNVNLADKPIDPLDCPPEFFEDTPAKTFIDMVNGSVQPVNNDHVPHLPPTGGSIGTCRLAEYHFLRTIDYLRRVDARGIMPTGCEIITHEGEPLLLRKGDGAGEHSSLTLSEVVIRGILYPAGSLLRLETDTKDSLYVPRGRVETITAERVTGANFLRLSAYALRPEERDISFTPHEDFTLSERKTFKETTVEEIGKITRLALNEISEAA